MTGPALFLLATSPMVDPTAPAEIGAFVLAIAGALLVAGWLASRANSSGWRWVVRATGSLCAWLVLCGWWVWSGRAADSVVLIIADIALIGALASVWLAIGEFDAAPATLVEEPNELVR
jgi:hypothetical protein